MALVRTLLPGALEASRMMNGEEIGALFFFFLAE